MTSHLRSGGVGTECTGRHDLQSKFSASASSLLCDFSKELSFSLPPFLVGQMRITAGWKGWMRQLIQCFEQLGLKESILAVTNIIIKLHTAKSEILFLKSALTIRLGS